MSAPKGNTYAKGNKGGRPRTIDLKDLQPFGDVLVDWASKRFKKMISEPDVSKKLPFFMRTFAREQNMSLDTIQNYCKQDKVFFGQYRIALQIVTEALILGGMKGWFNPKVFAFIVKNETEMKDKIETDITSGGKEVAVITGMQIIHENTQEKA